MAGYTRQDTVNNIADGNIINASDFDNEYDAIEAAFSAVSGHTHDGTAAEGAPITKVGPNQDVVVSASAVLPKTDSTLDLGSASFEFKDLYIDGTANIDSLVADTADINAGTIDGVVIGGASAGAGTFTSLNASGNVFFDGGSFVFNESGADKDARFEGDGDPNLLFLDASTDRVGIGTSSPAYKLDVNGTARILNGSTAFIVDSFGAVQAPGGVYVNTSGTRESGINSSGNDLRFRVGNADDRMILDASGNLGLGVTPSAWVAGANALQLGNAGYTALSTATGGDSNLTSNVYLSAAGTWTAIVSLGASRYQLDFGAHRWFTAPSGTAGNAISFTQAMTLDASGNLGIGTSSPSARVQVNAASSGSGLIVGQLNQTASEVNIGIGYRTAGYPFVGTNANSNPLEIGTLSNTHTAFITNNTERARIDASGRLGVGTASPLSVIHGKSSTGVIVSETTQARNSNNNYISFRDSSGEAGYVGYGANDSRFYIWNGLGGDTIFGANNTERARFTSAGDFIHQVNGTAPTLSTNSTMSFELTSNTSLKVVVRGTDGVTRSVSLTLT